MNFESLYTSSRVIEAKSTIFVPPNYSGEKNIIMPDSVVNFCIDHFRLCKKGVKVIDPMCGVGTIPRVINSQGGNCIGVELDEERFKVASSVVDGRHLIKGDFTELNLFEHRFNCVFTSMPFLWFGGEILSGLPDPVYANRFAELL